MSCSPQGTSVPGLPTHLSLLATQTSRPPCLSSGDLRAWPAHPPFSAGHPDITPSLLVLWGPPCLACPPTFLCWPPRHHALPACPLGTSVPGLPTHLSLLATQTSHPPCLSSGDLRAWPAHPPFPAGHPDITPSLLVLWGPPCLACPPTFLCWPPRHHTLPACPLGTSVPGLPTHLSLLATQTSHPPCLSSGDLRAWPAHPPFSAGHPDITSSLLVLRGPPCLACPPTFLCWPPRHHALPACPQGPFLVISLIDIRQASLTILQLSALFGQLKSGLGNPVGTSAGRVPDQRASEIHQDYCKTMLYASKNF